MDNMNEQKVLNNGYVKLVEYLGGDEAVIRNARLCWKSESKGEKSDLKLLRHLLKKGHKTPFEAMVFTFEIKCPLFVARQWFRHRMASYNEVSLRYCLAERDYFLPEGLSHDLLEIWKEHNERCFELYNVMVGEHQVRKELARALLPIGIYTRFFWTVNGSSLMNFLLLRTDEQAQKEIREYAAAILKIGHKVAPYTFLIFNKHVLKGDFLKNGR